MIASSSVVLHSLDTSYRHGFESIPTPTGASRTRERAKGEESGCTGGRDRELRNAFVKCTPRAPAYFDVSRKRIRRNRALSALLSFPSPCFDKCLLIYIYIYITYFFFKWKRDAFGINFYYRCTSDQIDRIPKTSTALIVPYPNQKNQ